MHRTQIYFEETMFETIKQKASALNISVSSYIRIVMKKELDSQQIQKEPIDFTGFSGLWEDRDINQNTLRKKGMEMILLDTNVLIEILKNNTQTIQQVSALTPPLAISSITAMELIYGALNKQEVKKLQQFINKFQVIHLEPEISLLALKLVTTYAKSHTLDIPDALIAATAIHNKSKLLTYNLKDFQYIESLELF